MLSILRKKPIIFLTGSTGTVGSSVFHHLQEKKYEVSTITRNHSRTHVKSRIINDDLENISNYDESLSMIDGIIHSAAERSNTYKKDVTKDISNLLKIIDIWSRGVFVYCSSQKVYKESKDKIFEDSTVDSIDTYTLAKLISEEAIIRSYEYKKNINEQFKKIVIFRLPIVLNSKPASKFQYLDYYIESALHNKTFYFECSEKIAKNFGTSWISDYDVGVCLVNSLQNKLSGIVNIYSSFISYISLLKEIINQTGSNSRILYSTNYGDVRMPMNRTELGSKYKDCWQSDISQPNISNVILQNLNYRKLYV